MLVVSRKVNESIVIGENIVVTVVQIRGERVRLGIEAPSKTTIYRRETYDAIRGSETSRNETGFSSE